MQKTGTNFGKATAVINITANGNWLQVNVHRPAAQLGKEEFSSVPIALLMASAVPTMALTNHQRNVEPYLIRNLYIIAYDSYI